MTFFYQRRRRRPADDPRRLTVSRVKVCPIVYGFVVNVGNVSIIVDIFYRAAAEIQRDARNAEADNRTCNGEILDGGARTTPEK